MLILYFQVFTIYCFNFVSLALVDSIFLLMIVIRQGICTGILGQDKALDQDSMPLWLKTIYPYFIEPFFYISRLCTVYMVVVVSLERLQAVYSPLIYNSRCRYYISTAVFFSSKAYFINASKKNWFYFFCYILRWALKYLFKK